MWPDTGAGGSAPYIESPVLEYGASSVIFLEDGRLDTLEIFAYVGPFPEVIEDYSLKTIESLPTGRPPTEAYQRVCARSEQTVAQGRAATDGSERSEGLWNLVVYCRI